MDRSLIKITLLCFALAAAGIFWVLYSGLHAVVLEEGELSFEVETGESVAALAEKLEQKGIILDADLFRKYISWKNLDTKIQAGTYQVQGPVTLLSVINTLKTPTVGERTITIIPGWTIREVADYLEREGVASAKEVYQLLGTPVEQGTAAKLAIGNGFLRQAKHPDGISVEGYLRPDTFRFLSTATAEEILVRLMAEREKEFTPELLAAAQLRGKTIHEVLTIASILEREVRSTKDRRLVSDIFWRRAEQGWPLQADSSVHYVTGKKGDVFTTKADRETDSPWNTYKYPGLPLGPIAMPSRDSIQAAINPEPNDYWYFITTLDTGEVKYASDLEGHNRNVATYLR